MFTACAVTWTMSRVQGEPEQGEAEVSDVDSVVVPDWLLYLAVTWWRSRELIPL